MSITPSRTVILAEYRRGGKLVLLERVISEFNHFRVTETDEYRAIDKAESAYMARVPASAHDEQKTMIRNGLRFAEQRQAEGGNNVNTKTGTGQRKRG